MLTETQQVQQLESEHTAEVLSFLSARPLHTFIKASWIQDNGLVSPLNRGTFYGYRDAAGKLQGVALIGHVTLFEAMADPALRAFAQLTQHCSSARVVLSEATKFTRFMTHYMNEGRPPSFVRRELLLEKTAVENLNTLSGLRPANPDELELVVPIHAQAAFEQSGVNPLDVDAFGFRKRCARRIGQGRVWVSVKQGRLKFKADVVSHTPNVVYLEGVYVSPEHRGNGYGARCITQLTNHLLKQSKSVCVLVKETNSAAQACYRKAGYKFCEYYDTLYLPPQARSAQEIEL